MDLVKELRPSTPTQHLLIDELLEIENKLRLIRRAEFRILNTTLGETTPRPLDMTTMKPPTEKALQLAATDPAAEQVALHFLNPEKSNLTTLWSYQLRFQARFQSILRQFPKLAQEQIKLQKEDQRQVEELRRQDLDERFAHWRREQNQKAHQHARPARPELAEGPLVGGNASAPNEPTSAPEPRMQCGASPLPAPIEPVPSTAPAPNKPTSPVTLLRDTQNVPPPAPIEPTMGNGQSEMGNPLPPAPNEPACPDFNALMALYAPKPAACPERVEGANEPTPPDNPLLSSPPHSTPIQRCE